MKNINVDGLRGIAALSVTVAHFVCAYIPSLMYNNYPTIFNKNPDPSLAFEIIASPAVTLFFNGHFAVLIFFVLSGYVLSMPYYSDNADPKEIIKKRLWGRYLRLNIPVLSAIILSYLIYSLGMYTNVHAAEVSGSTNWLKTFYPSGMELSEAIKEGVYDSIIFGKSLFLPPLWTLRIEFVGSLYLLIFYLIKPCRHTAAPLALFALFIYCAHPQDSIYLYGILLGSLINKVKPTGHAKWGLFAFGIYFGGFQQFSPMYNFLPDISIFEHTLWDKKTFYNLIGALLISTAIVKGAASYIMQSRPAQFLGKISFSIYLVHLMILCSLSSYIYTSLPQGKIYLLANFSIYIASCIILSILFEKIIDRPAIKISHKFTERLFKI